MSEQVKQAEQAYVEKQPSAVESTSRGRYYVPSVDILENADELLLVADVPGAAADQIDVRYEDGELRIHAPVAPREAEGRRYLLQEYGVGDYYRAFRIGDAVDAARIGAEYVDGVLTLHLPKSEAIKPRRIAVKAV